MNLDYKGPLSYYDKYQPSDDYKRPCTSYLDVNSYSDKANLSKCLRWNIEESKENLAGQQNKVFTSSFSNLPKPISPQYLSTEQYTKSAGNRTFNDFSKVPASKSYKNIKFSNQFANEYEYSKNYQNVQELSKDFEQKKQDLKKLTVSLGYKTTLKDLVPNYKKQNFDKIDDGFDSLKRMKSSKSQKRINYEIDTKCSFSKLQIPKSPYTPIKSFKRIADIVGDQKPKEYLPPFCKSSKNIKDDDFRVKTQKTKTYNQHYQYECSTPSRKHHTVGYDASPSVKEIGKTNKLSINDFELGKCKGEGAFGQVFPAIHKQTRMLVAIKKVPKQKVKYMLQQFINEIKIQMFLDHPNIVKLYGCFDDATNFYILMEYMEGGNVFNLIKKAKKLTQQDTSERLKEICLGLKQMHDHSILHRDIKPQNIVITNDVCKLCDFGWSAICKDRRTTYCGTLDYVSPQIIEGEGYDDSVDIWCIGVLAYEMICGKTPFYNISRKETMKKIMNVTYEYPPELNGKAKAFIDKILKRNPTDRLDIDEILKDKFLQK